MSFDPEQEDHDRLKVRWINNISFMVELFKLKMLTEMGHAIMHDCVAKLLTCQDDKSLGCLCDLLSAIGEDLDVYAFKVMHRLHTCTNKTRTNVLINTHTQTQHPQMYYTHKHT